MNKHSPKLTGEQKAIIINMLGAWCSIKEIIKYFKHELNISISYAGVDWYKQNKKQEIAEATVRWKKSLEIIPLANKFKRILARADLVKDLQKHLWRQEKTAYGKKFVGSHNHINNILDSIQAEVEPAKLALTDPTGDFEYKGEQSEDERARRIIEALRSIKARQERDGITGNGFDGNGGDDVDSTVRAPDKGSK